MMRLLVSLYLFVGIAALGRPARADEESAAQLQDRKESGGLGTQLGFRGIGYDFHSDVTVAAGKGMDAVETSRLGGAALLWPSRFHVDGYWGVWAGAETALVRFEKDANPDDPTKGGLFAANIVPMIGMIFTGPGDRLRFDIDAAPVISTEERSPLASQAALISGIATAPHDDLLYLPNLRTAGRVRMRLSRRWDLGRRFSISPSFEIEAGYAETRATYGESKGKTGGGLVDLKWYVRTYYRHFEGVIVSLDADVGYTSVWAGNVVLPTRVGGGVAIAVMRDLEARAGFGFYTPSIALGSLHPSAYAITLGAKFSFDTSTPTWLQGDVERQELEGGPTR